MWEQHVEKIVIDMSRLGRGSKYLIVGEGRFWHGAQWRVQEELIVKRGLFF